MYHRNYTNYLQRELDFLKLLVSRFHEQEKVNVLELDVALQKTQEVYEHLLRVKLIPEVEASAALTVEKTIPTPVQQPEPPKKEPPPRPQPVYVAAPEKVPVVKEEKKQQIEPAKSGILADKLGPSISPINETLAQQKTSSDLSSKLQTAPLNSISSGIGLNDKFLFIRELFKSDNVLFNNVIKHLDTAGSLAAALKFISTHFDWDEKNETAQKFINLIHRRYGNN